MAVFVYSTGSIQIDDNTAAIIVLTIENRTTTQESFRVFAWNTSSDPKTPLIFGPFGILMTIPPNGTALRNLQNILTLPGLTNFEIEIRLSNPHMVPYIQLSYTGLLGPILRDIYAGEMFFDSTEIENP